MRKALTALALAAAVGVLAGPAYAQTDYPADEEALTVSDTRVTVGQPLTVSGDDAPPNTEVQLIFRSTPRVVARTTSDSSGQYSASFQVPSDAEAGTHTITAVANGVVLSSTTVVVAGSGSAAAGDDLPFTGSSTLPGIGIGVALIAIGGGLLMVSRRRRNQQPEHESVS